MHWSLDQLRDLETDEFDELLAWVGERSQQNEPDSVDADALIQAAKHRDAKQRGEAEDDD